MPRKWAASFSKRMEMRSIPLHPLEEALYQAAVLVHVLVVRALPADAAGSWRDDRDASARLDRRNEGIRVVPFVGHNVRVVNAAEQLRRLRDVVCLAFGQRDSNCVSGGVHNHVNLCGGTASGMPDRFGSPFFAPVAS